MTLIADLVSLHHVDSQARALRSRLEGAQRHRTIQERQGAQLQTRMDEVRAQIRHHQSAAANHEAESGSVDARVESLRQQLNASTNPRQYSAILAEMKTLQTKRDEIDELALAQMQKAEDLQTKLAEIELQASERAKIVDVAKAEFETCRAEVAERLASLEQERAAAAARVPRGELDLYDGEAMAELVTIDMRRREYVCGACNMELPAEKYATLASNPNVAVTCTSCQRILFLPQVATAHS
jgi:predicted  nucleic acid-binding Zn-ribbon protein